MAIVLWSDANFNPQGPRGPRQGISGPCGKRNSYFNPQGPRGPRPRSSSVKLQYVHFNPQGPRGPRPHNPSPVPYPVWDFNPQGPRGPRPGWPGKGALVLTISIHKALAGLDGGHHHQCPGAGDFNPQGPRGPRRRSGRRPLVPTGFQSTRPSRASTA